MITLNVNLTAYRLEREREAAAFDAAYADAVDDAIDADVSASTSASTFVLTPSASSTSRDLPARLLAATPPPTLDYAQLLFWAAMGAAIGMFLLSSK